MNSIMRKKAITNQNLRQKAKIVKNLMFSNKAGIRAELELVKKLQIQIGLLLDDKKYNEAKVLDKQLIKSNQRLNHLEKIHYHLFCERRAIGKAIVLTNRPSSDTFPINKVLSCLSSVNYYSFRHYDNEWMAKQ